MKSIPKLKIDDTPYDDYFEIYVEVSEREYRNGTQRIW